MKTECPHHKLRDGLPPLIDRIAALPIDERGYPVPFFVAWIDGKPDFRMVDPEKLVQCVKGKLCWVCGQPMGRNKVFLIGPMCCITRTTAEPPSHLNCAEWSVKGCPFLTRPNMVRREDDFTRANEENVPGEMIKRNPGVTAMWSTSYYTMFPDPAGKVLFQVGSPEGVSWWKEGRPATRQDVMESIESGIHFLLEACDREPTPRHRDDALAELAERRKAIEKLLPDL